MPGLFGGFYVVGEGQLGGYHPLHWLLYRTLPLDRALRRRAGARVSVACSRARGCGSAGGAAQAAAAFGAMTATFCGFTLVHGVHPNMVGRAGARAVAALGARRRCGAARSRHRLAAGPAGHGPDRAADRIAVPPRAPAIGVVLWPRLRRVRGALIRPSRPARWIRREDAGRRRGAGPCCWRRAECWPRLDAAAQSNRPAFDVDFATQYSLRPLHLLHLLHPYLFWGRMARWNETALASDEFGVYGGGVALLLAVWWVGHLALALRWPSALAMHATPPQPSDSVCGVRRVGLWLATGSYGRLYYLQTWLPLVSQFRAPVRYIAVRALGDGGAGHVGDGAPVDASCKRARPPSDPASDRLSLGARGAWWWWQRRPRGGWPRAALVPGANEFRGRRPGSARWCSRRLRPS